MSVSDRDSCFLEEEDTLTYYSKCLKEFREMESELLLENY